MLPVGDSVGLRQHRQALALSPPLDHFGLLVRRQARSRAELHTGLDRPAAAFASAIPDQLPLNLREAVEHRQQKPPVRCRSVRRGIGLEPLTKVAWRTHINIGELRGSPTAFDNGALQHTLRANAIFCIQPLRHHQT
jgi:hypothetical protein